MTPQRPKLSAYHCLVVLAAFRVLGCAYATPKVHVPESLPAFGPLVR